MRHRWPVGSFALMRGPEVETEAVTRETEGDRGAETRGWNWAPARGSHGTGHATERELNKKIATCHLPPATCHLMSSGLPDLEDDYRAGLVVARPWPVPSFGHMSHIIFLFSLPPPPSPLRSPLTSDTPFPMLDGSWVGLR